MAAPGDAVDEDEPADPSRAVPEQQPVPGRGVAVDVADGERLARGQVLAPPRHGVDKQGVGHARPDGLADRERGAVRCPPAEPGGARRTGLRAGERMGAYGGMPAASEATQPAAIGTDNPDLGVLAAAGRHHDGDPPAVR